MLNFARLSSLAELLSGFADIHHDVVNDREIAGASFESLNVAVFFEVGRDGEY